jgi:hypothetical protein
MAPRRVGPGISNNLWRHNQYMVWEETKREPERGNAAKRVLRDSEECMLSQRGRGRARVL